MFKFSDPIEVAAHCARAALGMMDRHGVPAHPNNFIIWYAFVADRDPELTKAINGVLRAGQKFSDDVCADLYERFFGTSQHEAELRAVGQRIENAVAQVLAYLSTANQGAAQYGEALVSFSGELNRDPAPNDLGDLIRGILDETKSMIEVNRQLEERLESSSGEIARLREDLDQLKREATTDALTGLANRKLFDVALREAALEGEEDRSFLCLLMIDIDFFKQFNDSHGHMLGDQVLKLVARTIQDSVKGKDTAARYGGEEFAVILPGTRLIEAIAVADTIRRNVASRKVLNRRTNQVLGQVTLSIGVAEYEFGESLGAFVHRADEALYMAKREGRNRVISQTELRGTQALDFEP
ncbi:putative diguanylate cyclase (GGDEF) domain [Magnetospirillum sp. LM-5]|uniref:GGDEF domain-containing protein n=1 Tax=Magnetospirillum sp. LM-5 TaxID=2681466 RepID=UPI00138032D6|nr:GGDEF domain-containing protein [Magnetospirillum sp. LM-5]CAA7626015.1 putative diguanylate cyclase (GGDEF) domain [Magnetospirillum sp. LM-5]